jgi:hypothetical protein
MAWPTASYRRVTVDDVQALDDGARVAFTLHGISGLDGSALWVQVYVEVRSGRITRLEWGNYNGFFAPGTAINIMAEVLANLNEQLPRDSRRNALQ